jgi:hypothetical protein
MRFIDALNIIAHQSEFLGRFDQDRRPTGEIPHETDLNGSPNVKRRKPLRVSHIQDQGALLLFLN